MLLVWNSFIRGMRLFWTTFFLLLCQTIEELECEYQTTPEDAADVMNRTERYFRPVDFRCYVSALADNFNFKDQFSQVKYALEDDPPYDKKHSCTNFAGHYYPILRGLDPMMPYYINTLHRGIALANNSKLFLSRNTPLQRTKFYCASMRLIAGAFLEYWESFHSDNNLCKKMVEFIKTCNVFRQMRDMFATKLSERLCLDEDGCYNAMKYYEDDLPYCVKTTAISEFKNSPVGSWHHAILNYCKLTKMVPGVNEAKYDTKILRENGRTREKLTEMCLYFRYRVLPEEGKEQEMPDLSDYEIFDEDTTTGKEYQNGTPLLFATAFWSIIYFGMTFG